MIQCEVNNHKDYSYLVAGLGRCGTTLVFDAILHETGRKMAYNSYVQGHYVDNLNTCPFKLGEVYKTHSEYIELPERVKAIFLFGDPRNIALSVLRKGQAWFYPHHHGHMHATRKNVEEVIYQDTMNLERLFNSWINRPNVLYVKYETMGKHYDEISEFFGLDLKMPDFVPRGTNCDECSWDMLDALNTTYGYLATRIGEFPEISKNTVASLKK